MVAWRFELHVYFPMLKTLALKCMIHVWSKKFFLHNFILQYVNKSIVIVHWLKPGPPRQWNGRTDYFKGAHCTFKVLQNKYLVVILPLKTAQFLSKNGQETGTRLLCTFILWCGVVDRIANSTRPLVLGATKLFACCRRHNETVISNSNMHVYYNIF